MAFGYNFTDTHDPAASPGRVAGGVRSRGAGSPPAPARPLLTMLLLLRVIQLHPRPSCTAAGVSTPHPAASIRRYPAARAARRGRLPRRHSRPTLLPRRRSALPRGSSSTPTRLHCHITPSCTLSARAQGAREETHPTALSRAAAPGVSAVVLRSSSCPRVSARRIAPLPSAVEGGQDPPSGLAWGVGEGSRFTSAGLGVQACVWVLGVGKGGCLGVLPAVRGRLDRCRSIILAVRAPRCCRRQDDVRGVS